MSSPAPVTRLLLDWRSGDQAALDQLVPLVYDELRALAGKRLGRERPDHTLQPTALVHEAYARLVDADVAWQDRAHFVAVAARTMRRILVDHARARMRQKRGGGARAVTMEEGLVAVPETPEALVALDAAMEQLAAVDSRKADVVELHFFGGLTYAETAEALGISAATVDRDLRMAKAWLFRELGGGERE